MSLLYGSLFLMLLLAVHCVRTVRHEYRASQILSPPTVVAVWVLYTLHAALTVLSAWHAIWPLPLGPGTGIAVGTPLVAGGLGLAVAGAVEFRSLRRMSGMLTNKLVTSGAYRLTRNPQNVGCGVSYLGVALLGRSGLALVLVGAFWVAFLAYVPVEEEYLERIFGDQYRRYRAATPRLFGWPGRPADPDRSGCLEEHGGS